MKTEKQLRKDLLKYLKGLKKNCKKYAVFGSYEDDNGNRHKVWEEDDTMEGCCEWWNEVESYIRVPRYERLMNDPQVLEECKEHYDDWDDMDEGEQDDALDQHVIEGYCSYEDMDEVIDLVWFNQKELIDNLIDEIKSDPNWEFYETKHKVDDKLITVKTKSGGTKTGLVLGESNWRILEEIEYDRGRGDDAASLKLEYPQYRVKCLINGKIHWIPLYEFVFCNQHIECGILDYRTEWRQ